MSMVKDLCELSAEISAISATVSGLSYQLGEENCDRLSEKGMRESLFGISCYLDRISEDLTNVEVHYDNLERGGVENE